MSFLDKLKGTVKSLGGSSGDLKAKAAKAVDDHSDQISAGLDKAGEAASKVTKGKYDDKIDKGVSKAKNALDNLDGKNDDLT
ncbi:MAG: antitoxin [Nocardioidaceae bacterium]